MLSVQPSTKTSEATHSSNLPQDSKVPALNLSVLSRAAPPIPSLRTSVTARAPQKLSPATPRAKVPQTSRDPPTPDVHHQLSSLRPPALVSSARSAHANEQSFRPSSSRIDERIDMRPFSEAGTSMIGSEELGRVQASLLKHVPVGGHRHYSQVAEETSQRFTDFADLMAVRSPDVALVFNTANSRVAAAADPIQTDNCPQNNGVIRRKTRRRRSRSCRTLEKARSRVQTTGASQAQHQGEL